MESTRIFRFLLDRSPAAVIIGLEELLIKLSHLFTDFAEIGEADLSPVLIKADRMWIADARIEISRPPVKAPMHLIISPYPNQYKTMVTGKSGQRIFIRPIRPEDAPLLGGLFKAMSPQSVYFRFLKPVKELTPDLMVRFTQLDYDREIALVALDRSSGPDVMMGVARLYGEPEAELAEFSVAVGDPWQGQGIGAELLRRLIVIGREKRIKRIWGLVMRENTAMLELGRKLGWRIVEDSDSSQVEMSLDLT
jgi:acetyltransferase